MRRYVRQEPVKCYDQQRTTDRSARRSGQISARQQRIQKKAARRAAKPRATTITDNVGRALTDEDIKQACSDFVERLAVR